MPVAPEATIDWSNLGALASALALIDTTIVTGPLLIEVPVEPDVPEDEEPVVPEVPVPAVGVSVVIPAAGVVVVEPTPGVAVVVPAVELLDEPAEPELLEVLLGFT